MSRCDWCGVPIVDAEGKWRFDVFTMDGRRLFVCPDACVRRTPWSRPPGRLLGSIR